MSYVLPLQAPPTGTPSVRGAGQGGGLASFTDDLLATVKGYGQDLEETIIAVQRIDKNIEEIKPYVPVLVGGLFSVAGGLLIHAIVIARRSGNRRGT